MHPYYVGEAEQKTEGRWMRPEQETHPNQLTQSMPAGITLTRKMEPGCYGRPKGCDCRTNCTLLAEWWGASKDSYSVTLSGGLADGYLAIGWPTVGDMGPAPVIACAAAGLPYNNNMTAINWNTADETSIPATIFSPMDIVTNVAVAVVDGLLRCSFEVKASFQVGTASRDLNAEAYFVILATGPLEQGKIMQHAKEGRGHSPSPFYWADYNSFIPEQYGCYGRPKGCDCRTNCTLLAEWRGSTKDTYSVVLSGGLADGYLAMGWPTVGDMGPAPVIVCAAASGGLSDNNNLTAVYWNTDNEMSAPAPDYSPVDLVTPVSVAVVDGQLKCSLEVKANFQVATTARDLNTEAYFVILATGLLEGGQIMQHSKEGRGHSPSAFFWSDYNSYLSFNYLGCNITVGCEGLPIGCVADRNCSLLLRYHAAAEDSYQFSLSGQATSAEAAYLAIGLSLDNRMGDDSVVACIPDGRVGAVMYWNKEGNSIQLPNTTAGLTDGVVNVADGIISCTFFLQVPPPYQFNKFC